MDEIQTTARPVGRKRQLAGLILLALGALIGVRMAWLVGFSWAWFGREEWIRFAFWVWVGAVLALTGCWLRYQSRLAGWAAAIAVPSFVGLVYLADRLGL